MAFRQTSRFARLISSPLVVLSHSLIFAVSPERDSGPNPASPSKQFLKSQHFYQVTDSLGRERLVTKPLPDDSKPRPQRTKPQFRAVLSDRWPSGMVPIFEVKNGSHFQLKRLPITAEGTTSEPLFFGFPDADDIQSENLSGRWTLCASGEGTNPMTALDLAFFGEEVSARFDPNTDFSVAHLDRGSFRNNVIELTARYIAEVYLLRGKFENGAFKGEWRHQTNPERGTWEATRESPPVHRSSDTVLLYEWKHHPDGPYRYALDGDSLPVEWTKNKQPLCRVWRSDPNAP